MKPVFKVIGVFSTLFLAVVAETSARSIGNDCKGVLTNSRVQSFAAEVLAQMSNDYESPGAVRQSFVNGLEARAKRERYPPITVGRPGHPQPIRFADIIGCLNQPSVVDASFPMLTQFEARITAKQRAAAAQQRREAKLGRESSAQTSKSPACPSALLAHPAIQKAAAAALKQTIQDVSTNPNINDAERVFDTFQRTLYLITKNYYHIRGETFQSGLNLDEINHDQAADIDRAIHDMTFDQFTNCFPQAGQLAHATQQAQDESKRQREKAREEAMIEAAKPINQLKQAYFAYLIVKRCYDVRLGYLLVYINEVEMERARLAVSAIEISILKEDPSIDKNNAWEETVRLINSSNVHVEQYFCQKTYNDLLNAAPSSPPVKDF
jgi:hypothetical protein